jgi:hypothetical protein
MPGDIDGILDTVRRIILMGEVQSISIRNDEPITYQRFVRPGEELKPSESTSSFAELSAMEVVRNVPMEEYPPGTLSPADTVLKMFIAMAFDGWVVTHILIGDHTQFWTWLGIEPLYSKRISQFLGARIEREKTLPSGVFILCGSKTRSATISEIGCALKGNIV